MGWKVYQKWKCSYQFTQWASTWPLQRTKSLYHKRKLDFNVIEMTFIIHVFALELPYFEGKLSCLHNYYTANIYTEECNIIIACMHAAKGCYSAKIQSAKTFLIVFPRKFIPSKIYLLYNNILHVETIRMIRSLPWLLSCCVRECSLQYTLHPNLGVQKAL